MSVYHGGNLALATQQYGMPKGGWVDLSTGINPHAYPIPDVSLHSWQRLPDQELVQKNRLAACDYYGVKEKENLLAVSGTQVLLQILPRLFEKPLKVRVVEPTYQEHAHCWALAGHEVKGVSSLEDAAKDGDIVIVVTPNNPTGKIYSSEELEALRVHQEQKGGYLIVDGAFMDVADDQSIMKYAGRAGLIILRSFGKFFGLAGIRLGYVVAPVDMIDQLSNGLGPWSVNGPALEISTQAFQNKSWIINSKKELANKSQKLDALLSSAGLHTEGGTTLFRFIKHHDAHTVFNHLASHGIWLRAFEHLPENLRFGLPQTQSDWDRVESALSSL